MNIVIRLSIIWALFTSLTIGVKAQTNFYDVSTIQKIEIFFTQPNWDYMMDTSKIGADGYILASQVKINGVAFDSAGVKYKGNSSYDSTYIKNPLHIELDHFKDQSYQNYEDIKLSNCYSDPSMIREVLAYQILGNYMDCPKSNFAKVYINGNYVGLYSNDESINKKFLSDNFSSSGNTFVKCNPIVNPGPTTKSNLKYINSDSSSYANFYEMKSDIGWNDLVKLTDSVTNNASSIGNMMDIDRTIWMLAFNNVLVNLDSYTGAFCQNYYLYKDNSGRYSPIIWDLNMAFGGFPYLGSGATSMMSLNVLGMQQLSLTAHSTDNYWPLIKNILSDATYKKMYIAHSKTIMDEFIANWAYQTLAQTYKTLVDSAVIADTNKFYSYSEFQNAMTQNVSETSYIIPGISTLMDARNTFLQATTEFQYSQPNISSVQSSNTSPALNSTFYITANISNSSVAYLAYRFSSMAKFTKVAMYDDGNHGDGTSGDNVFGASITMLSGLCEYYIYAENSNSAAFSPARAEHEFYSLSSTTSGLIAGSVAINEFMALNDSYETDENGEYEDWVELKNLTNSAIDLGGAFLSDNFSNPTKFTFPSGTTIQPNGYLIIFCDEDPTTTSYVHATFKLSGSGEELMLSNSSGDIIDSVSFGAQSDDVSMGRCPDGTGAFGYLTNPSFMSINCPVGIEETERPNFSIFPNPSDGNISIANTTGENLMIEIVNLSGQVVQETQSSETIIDIDFSSQNKGIYLCKISTNQVLTQIIKLVKF